jgi:predicted MPP superfamily phosphohydrolase
MTHDWQWPVMLALAVPTAVGHLCHFVLVINVASGLGFREEIMDRVRTFLFACFWASSALLLWKHMREPWWHWSWPLGGYALLCLVSGTIIWPVASLRLARRRRPQGITGSSQTLDLARCAGPDPLIGDGRHSWMLRLPRHDSFRLNRREWDVTIAGLPAPLDGLQIVHLSDFHLARCFERRFFELVVAASRGWPADLVVITGDLVDDDDTIAWIEPVLGQVQARLGKLAVLGNHDFEHEPSAIIHELDRAGFEILEGRWTTRDVDDSTIAIGGTSAPWGPPLDPSDIPTADLRILLSHSPDLFYKAREWGIDLMLSGHNHGGQVRIPLVGSVFMPSRYSRRLDRGFFRSGRTLLYVSEGVAGKHPIRYGCLPEVSRFVLHSVKDGPRGEREMAQARKEEIVRERL